MCVCVPFRVFWKERKRGAARVKKGSEKEKRGERERERERRVEVMLRRGAVLFHYIGLDQVTALVQAKLAHHPSVAHTILVDVRSTAEVAKTGVIPTAVNIPLGILSTVLDSCAQMDPAEVSANSASLPLSAETFAATFGVPPPVKGVTQLVFYCAHGVRSATAVELADQFGFTGARNFSGSWAQWEHMHGGSRTSPCGLVERKRITRHDTSNGA